MKLYVFAVMQISLCSCCRLASDIQNPYCDGCAPGRTTPLCATSEPRNDVEPVAKLSFIWPRLMDWVESAADIKGMSPLFVWDGDLDDKGDPSLDDYAEGLVVDYFQSSELDLFEEGIWTFHLCDNYSTNAISLYGISNLTCAISLDGARCFVEDSCCRGVRHLSMVNGATIGSRLESLPALFPSLRSLSLQDMRGDDMEYYEDGGNIEMALGFDKLERLYYFSFGCPIPRLTETVDCLLRKDDMRSIDIYCDLWNERDSEDVLPDGSHYRCEVEVNDGQIDKVDFANMPYMKYLSIMLVSKEIVRLDVGELLSNANAGSISLTAVNVVPLNYEPLAKKFFFDLNIIINKDVANRPQDFLGSDTPSEARLNLQTERSQSDKESTVR